MAKRAPLSLDKIAGTPAAEPAEVPPVQASPPSAPAAGPEPIATIYVRAPWSLAERLKDLARARSKTEGRRVTVNDLAIEALRNLAR